MYASAMKYCGAMEVCGLGYAGNGRTLDDVWPEVLAQAKAQKAGLLIGWARAARPEEELFLRSKGFTANLRMVNPRTGNASVMMILFLDTGEEAVA